ncbi:MULTISPECIES: hypothetical protein [unclassified Pseudonocardia]|uniref:hypothetical protein n=1 Tax=unclassified Pseudonocardia TaxID=2619320 RepID=UPI00096A2129|nr:hypothetical protein [Pseudonocardia sp. Ae707_Ps1]OLM09122.1 hypothetical protein Ae707Ps1_6069c [Pseudonocardia sp. Ae707_Ps1]
MAAVPTRSVPLGFPTLVGAGGLVGMLGVGGQPWQVAVSGFFAAVLVCTDVVRGWSTVRDRRRPHGAS